MTGAVERGQRAVLAFAAAAFAGATMLPFGGPTIAEEFYHGKQVTIVVGFTSAGTYDATARLFARHLGKYLPGKPAVIVRNMPGAGSLVATRSLYGSAPKDGTTLGVIGGGVVLEPLLGNPQANYDPRRFNWIGGRTRDNFLCLVWHTVPVRTLHDATRRETIMGATGPGSRTLTYPRALNELLGTKFKIVTGYKGTPDRVLAMERGEIEGACGLTTGNVKAVLGRQYREGKLRVDRSRAQRPGAPSDRVSCRRFGPGLAAGRAARSAGGAPARPAFRLQRHDAGSAASRRGRRPRPRRRSGERRRDRRPRPAALRHAAGRAGAGAPDQRGALAGGRRCRPPWCAPAGSGSAS